MSNNNLEKSSNFFYKSQDLYYINIYSRILYYLPDFFALDVDNDENPTGDGLQYGILADLYRYYLKNIKVVRIESSFINFLEDALTKGGSDTKELIEIEVFEHYLNVPKEKVEKFRMKLPEKIVPIFDTYIATAKI